MDLGVNVELSNHWWCRGRRGWRRREFGREGEREGGERRICLEETAQQTAVCFSSSFFPFFLCHCKNLEREQTGFDCDYSLCEL